VEIFLSNLITVYFCFTSFCFIVASSAVKAADVDGYIIVKRYDAIDVVHDCSFNPTNVFDPRSLLRCDTIEFYTQNLTGQCIIIDHC